jgi:cytoskeletal protein RodZ
MENRWRLAVIAILAVVALVGGFAIGAVFTGRNTGQAGGTPSAEADATATPEATATDEAPSDEPTDEAPSDEPTAEATASPTPAAPPATVTISRLFVDAADNPDATTQVITFRSATGSVKAQVTGVTPGDITMCLNTPEKELGCRSAASGTLSAKTTKPSETFMLTLRGVDTAQPLVDVTLTFQAKKPKVQIDNARFDGTAYPDTNGIQATVTPRVDGKVGVTAQWGGKPLQYEIDLIEQGGPGNLTYAPDEGSIGTDVDFAVTAPNPWKVVLQNTESGFGITPMTVAITWP